MAAEIGSFGGPEGRHLLRNFMALSLLLVVVAAFFSDGVYHVDEYFQINEFVSLKLGRSEPANMAWEYQGRIRPWLQPALYFALAWPVSKLGVTDPFTLLFLFRIATGLIGWLALWRFCLLAGTWLATDAERSLLVKITALACFIPYLLVRTSSESLAAAFFLLGFVSLHHFIRSALDNGSSLGRHSGLFLAGLFLGLAFECRYQIAFPILGLLIWALVYGRVKIKAFLVLASGLLLAGAAGLLIDAWGYGGWVLVPWNYFRINIIQGRAAAFGLSPFYAFFYLIPSLLPPLGLLLLLALVLCWLRHPAHSITWVTLPLVLVHSLVGHKEPRFLFPLYVFAAAFLLMAFAPGPERLKAVAGFFWKRRNSGFAKCLVVLNFIFLALLCLVPVRHNFKLQKYIFRNFPQRFECYALGDYDPLMVDHVTMRAGFLEPKTSVVHKLGSLKQMKSVWRRAHGSLLLALPFPMTAAQQRRFAGRATLLYSYFPLFFNRWNSSPWLERIEWGCLYRIDPLAN